MTYVESSDNHTVIDISSKNQRLFYVDNIRIYLTVLVILHHIAIGYRGLGDWTINEVDFHPIDATTTILLLLFGILNQSYFMAFFFLLAGFFTPRSYDKKGTKLFLKDRFIRLGIPLMIYIVFLSPLTDFIVLNFAYGVNVSFFDILTTRITNLIIGVDHLWFLLILLIFAGFYTVYRIITSHYLSKRTSSFFSNVFPSNRVIILSISVIALITFIIRLEFLVGEIIFLNIQLAHLAHYAFCFWVGILAYRGKWFDNLSISQAKQWILVALFTIAFLPVILVLLVDFASNDPFGFFLGGLTLQSLVYVVWESVALLSISIGLLYIFRTKFNQQNRLLKELASSTYTAYIIHAIVIVSLMILFLPSPLPALVKFVVVSIIGVPLIFLLSYFIRKIPFINRVLG